jgi:adenine phosphoribosyltransferase
MGNKAPTTTTATAAQAQAKRDADKYCTCTFDPKDVLSTQARLVGVSVGVSVGVLPKNKANEVALQQEVAAAINTVVGFKNLPKFYDVGPLLKNPTLLLQAMQLAAAAVDMFSPTHIAGVDARGFVFGPLIAQVLRLPFVMIRKKGKLPNEAAVSDAYAKEYAAHDGLEQLAMQRGSVGKGDRVVVVDDICATGSTLVSCEQIVTKLGAEVVCHSCVVHIEALGAQKRLRAPVFHVVPEEMLK